MVPSNEPPMASTQTFVPFKFLFYKTANVTLDPPPPDPEAIGAARQSDSPEPGNVRTVVQDSLLADSSAPDGGYGWAVIFGCSVLSFWFGGTTYSWGVIQAALVERNVSSPSTLSFVGSLCVAWIAILALVNARVVRAMGARTTGLLGVGLMGVGEILAGFSAHSIGGLFGTIGVVMGIGVSLCFMVTSVTPAQYFCKRRGLANGIVYAGGGLGGTVISFALDGLTQRLGPAWTFRIMGLMTLGTGLPAACLIKDRIPIKINPFISRDLLPEPRFILLFLTGAVATFPLFVLPFFVPLYSTSLGLSTIAGASLVAGFNFSSFVGRLGCGYLSDVFGPLNTLLSTLFANALSMLIIWPLSTSLGPLVALVIINGAANGGFFATMPTVAVSIWGSAQVSVAMGMIVTGWAGGYLMGAPIAGYLLDGRGGAHATLKDYYPTIFYAGSMAAAAFILAALARFTVCKSILKKL